MTRTLSGIPIPVGVSGLQMVQGIADCVESVLSGCGGADWPTENLRSGLVAWNQTLKKWGSYNGSTWNIERPFGVDASSFEWFIHIGALSASTTLWLPPPLTGVGLLSLALISDTATTGSDGSNKWTFQVRNRTATLDLFATAPTTFGSEIAANVAYVKAFDQNLEAAAGSALDVVITKTGSPTSLVRAGIAVRGVRLGTA